MVTKQSKHRCSRAQSRTALIGAQSTPKTRKQRKIAGSFGPRRVGGMGQVGSWRFLIVAGAIGGAIAQRFHENADRVKE